MTKERNDAGKFTQVYDKPRTETIAVRVTPELKEKLKVQGVDVPYVVNTFLERITADDYPDVATDK